MTAVTLHYLTESRSSRVVWCLEELNVPYDAVVYYKNRQTFVASDFLREVNPNGTAPVLVDGDKTYTESALILDHLIEKYGKNSELAPRDHDEELEIRMNQYAAESNIMIYTLTMAIHRGAVAQAPLGLHWLLGGLFRTVDGAAVFPRLDRELKRIEKQIGQNGGYVVGGHFTAADIMLETSVLISKNSAVPDNFDENYPVLAAWLNRLSERPAHKRAREVSLRFDSKNSEAKTKPVRVSPEAARL